MIVINKLMERVMPNKDYFNPVAGREEQYGRVIKYLNIAAKQAKVQPRTSGEVLLQQVRELSYCQGIEQLSQREYLLFSDFAFFKALKTLYPKAFLIAESGIFLSMNLPFDENFDFNKETEARFDQASIASQARQALKEQCDGLLDKLREVHAKAEELKARSPERGDKNHRAYKTFKSLITELRGHIDAYEAEQTQYINATGRLNPEFNLQCKAHCQASIQAAAPVLSQHRGLGQILEKVVGAIRAFFGVKSGNQLSLTMFQTQSASKLQALSQAVNRHL
jgi:hypothetical protein